MPVHHIFGTAGATGGGFSAWKGLQPLFAEERLDVRPAWSWQRRSAKTWRDSYGWTSLWPRGSFGLCGADVSTPYTAQGLDYSGAQLYEPYSCDGAGCQCLQFIKGRVEDASGNAVSGADLTAYRTSDNAFAGYTVQSREDGSYDLPTNFPSVAHYVVAYIAGAPDRGGTTVDTLVPTSIDGS